VFLNEVCVFKWVEWMEVGRGFDIGGFGVLVGCLEYIVRRF